ncbi:hypothetical protein ABTE87_21595, partial [Acinetobacter baumannii]
MLLPLLGSAQNPAYKQASNYIQQHKEMMLEEFIQFLEIPNIATDKINIQRNAEWLMAAMKKRGMGDVMLLYP